MKKIENVKFTNPITGQTFKLDMADGAGPQELDVLVSTKLLIFSTLRIGGQDGATVKDSFHAQRVLAACSRCTKAMKQPAPLKLEDEDHKWLLEHVEKKAGGALGLYAKPYECALKGEKLDLGSDEDEEEEEKK